MGNNTRRSTLDKISNSFPDLNSNWLLTGEGDMLNGGGGTARLVGAVYPAEQKDADVIMVDYVPSSATASFIESLCGGPDFDHDKMPLVPMGNERQDAESLRVFEVEGESMFPTIPSGSLILAKEIPERSWHYAEGVVVAVYADMVVVKRVSRNNLLSGNSIILASDNPGYGEMEVALSAKCA